MKNLIVILSLMILTMFLGNEAKGQNSNLKNSNTELFTNQKRNVIKVDALSIIPGTIDLSYEYAITSRRSIHFSVGILGVDPFGLAPKFEIYKPFGNKEEVLVRPFGLRGNLGYRIYLFDFKYMKKPNILKGLYLEPNVIIGQYHVNNKLYDNDSIDRKITSSNKTITNYQAAIINVGYQSVISNRLILDMFMGLGIANDNIPNSEEQYYFGEFHTGLYKPDTGIAMGLAMGIKAGFAF